MSSDVSQTVEKKEPKLTCMKRRTQEKAYTHTRTLYILQNLTFFLTSQLYVRGIHNIIMRARAQFSPMQFFSAPKRANIENYAYNAGKLCTQAE